jgi:STAS domain
MVYYGLIVEVRQEPEHTLIDATGLGVLASAASRTAAHGASLYVVCAQDQVRRLFTITGLDRHIPLARTMTQARHNLAPAPVGDVLGQRPPGLVVVSEVISGVVPGNGFRSAGLRELVSRGRRRRGRPGSRHRRSG